MKRSDNVSHTSETQPPTQKETLKETQKNNPPNYKKGGIQIGPASLPTALLLHKNHFTQIIHRDITPSIPLLPALRTNTCTILPTLANNTLKSASIDAFFYLIDIFPHDYLSLKPTIDGKYEYINHNFRTLSNQLNIPVIDQSERDCLQATELHHAFVASIRRTDPDWTSSVIKWVEEEATDNDKNKHYFYSWKIPIFSRSENNPLMAICTRTLQLNPFTSKPRAVPFKRPTADKTITS